MNKNIFVLVLLVVFSCSQLAVSANRIVSVDDASAVVEINGQQYKVDLSAPLQGSASASAPAPAEEEVDYAELERQFLAMSGNADKYTGLPSVMNIRLYTQHSDRLLEAGHWGVDFTHRFSGEADDDTTGDLFGLDTFAYNSIGVHYGITDWLEMHVTRGNVGDQLEVGFKAKLLRETKKLSLLNPFNVTLHTGFQNDNFQDSIDPYIQLIMSRSIIPNRVQFYFSPTYAHATNSIAGPSSKSGIFFSFLDDDGRTPGDEGTFAIPLGLAVEVIKNRATLVGELVPVVDGFSENEVGWSVALQVLSKRETHIWTAGISNMPYVTTGQSIVGGPDNDIHLGFNVNIFL